MAAGRFTLIEMVQKILASLGSDAVNSISGNTEATQVAQLLEDVYYDLLNQNDWPWLENLIQLEAVADSERPNYLRIPQTVTRIDDFRYDCTDRVVDPNDELNIRKVIWQAPSEFLTRVQKRNSDTDNVQEVLTFNGTRLLILNDTCPTYWTSFDDEYVITDSFDNTIESTLEADRSQALVKQIPVFTLEDSFVADAPNNFFQLWLAEAKATAFNYWRQESSPEDIKRSRRGLAVMRRDANRTNNDDGRVKFGRRVIW